MNEVIEESITEPIQSDVDDDIIVLDSDADDNVHEPSRNNKAHEPSKNNDVVSDPKRLPEIITIDSSDEDEKPNALSGDAQSPSPSRYGPVPLSGGSHSPSQPREVRRVPLPFEKVCTLAVFFFFSACNYISIILPSALEKKGLNAGDCELFVREN